MQFLRIGLVLAALAITAPAFADSTVNVKLWDKNGDMNPDAKMGMGMPANMSMAMMKIELDKKAVPAGKVTFDVTNTSKATVHEMIVVPVADPKKTTLPYVSNENRVDEDAAGLGLPPGVDKRASSVTDHPVVPVPSLGIDRFPDRTEHA